MPNVSRWTRPTVQRVLQLLRETGLPDGYAPVSGGVPQPGRGPIGSGSPPRDMPGIDLILEVADLTAAVERLPDRHRAAVRAYYLSGREPSEAAVAEGMGISTEGLTRLLRDGEELIMDALTAPV